MGSLATAVLFIFADAMTGKTMVFCLEAVPHETIRKTGDIIIIYGTYVYSLPLRLLLYYEDPSIELNRLVVASTNILRLAFRTPLLTRLRCTNVRSLRHPPPTPSSSNYNYTSLTDYLITRQLPVKGKAGDN